MKTETPNKVLVIDEFDVAPATLNGCVALQGLHADRARMRPNEEFKADLTVVGFERGPGDRVLVLNGRSPYSKVVKVDHIMMLPEVTEMLQNGWDFSGRWIYIRRGEHYGLKKVPP